MAAAQKIKEMLKEVYDDGEVNAMQINKGYDASTGRTGWHIQRFGEFSEYIGASVAEVREFVDEVAETK